jgi:hypothetical protein
MFQFEADMSRKRTRAIFNVNHTMKFLFKPKIKIHKRIARQTEGINPLTPELNPSAQRFLTRIFYWRLCFLNRELRPNLTELDRAKSVRVSQPVPAQID